MKLPLLLCLAGTSKINAAPPPDLSTLLQNLYEQFYSNQKQHFEVAKQEKKKHQYAPKKVVNKPHKKQRHQLKQSDSEEVHSVTADDLQENVVFEEKIDSNDSPAETVLDDSTNQTDDEKEYEYIEYEEVHSSHEYEIVEHNDDKKESSVVKNFFKSEIEAQQNSANTEEELQFLGSLLNAFQSKSTTYGENFPDQATNYVESVSTKDEDDNIKIDQDAVENSDCSMKSTEGCASQIFHLDKIHRYGCWCFQGDLSSTGKGVPVNALDEACKNRNLCRRCIKIDDGTCNVFNHTYSTPNHVDIHESDDDFGNPQIGQLCRSLNPDDDCQAMNCACEVQFTIDIMDLWFNDVSYDPMFHHDEGFDWNLNCAGKSPGPGPGPGPNPTGGPKPTKPPVAQDCCGEFPRRKPYATNKSQCCSYTQEDNEYINLYKIYNPDYWKCCSTSGLITLDADCDEEDEA